jgi:hypothetical protein
LAKGFRVLGGNDCAWHTAVHVNHHGLFARASGEQQQWNQMQEFQDSKWNAAVAGKRGQKAMERQAEHWFPRGQTAYHKPLRRFGQWFA